jgi:hypothetical protein
MTFHIVINLLTGCLKPPPSRFQTPIPPDWWLDDFATCTCHCIAGGVGNRDSGFQSRNWSRSFAPLQRSCGLVCVCSHQASLHVGRTPRAPRWGGFFWMQFVLQRSHRGRFPGCANVTAQRITPSLRAHVNELSPSGINCKHMFSARRWSLPDFVRSPR